MQDPVVMWLIVGAGLIVFEAATAPGLGIFLAGLGALATAIIVQMGVVSIANSFAQFAWFFGLTTLWTIILWKPLKKFRTTRSKHEGKDVPEYKDMVGGIAMIGKGGLRRGEIGQALWSGTTMRAVLDEQALDEFVPEGARAEIVSVNGITLHLLPVPRS